MITIRKGAAVSVVPETAFTEIFAGQGWTADVSPFPAPAENIPEKPRKKKGGKDVTDRRAENNSA